jgi:hypothetical protein
MFIARYSAHINQDIVRNWSSWNFGQEGFEGTYEELQNELSQITDEKPFWVSGFDIYPSQKNQFRFGELYSNYWVAIDTRGRGLSCHIIEDAETFEQALSIVQSNKGLYDGTGDGDFIDCSGANVIYSEVGDGEFGLHIIEIKD